MCHDVSDLVLRVCWVFGLFVVMSEICVSLGNAFCRVPFATVRLSAVLFVGFRVEVVMFVLVLFFSYFVLAALFVCLLLFFFASLFVLFLV